jgi:undecaprenyl-diphosphatase
VDGATDSRRRLPAGHAAILGLLQGPAELLPISSSGHVVLLAALAGWPYGRLDPRHRKAFEVALHAGTAAGLTIVLRDEIRAALRSLDRERLFELALSTAPAAVGGLLLREAVEERLSDPRAVAGAQVAAGTVLCLADLRPADRGRRDAGRLDALALGAGQAAALAPGVSRGGGALTALRLRRMRRRPASVLVRHAAAPVMAGAAALQALRLAHEGLPRELAAPLALGAAVAFASTVASARLVAAMDAARTYAPLGAYRVALGGLALWRLGRRGRGG